MTTVREHVGPDAEGAGTGPAATAMAPSAGRGLSSIARDPLGLIGRHKLISVALVLAAVPRLVAMLGFRPAFLFRLDSYDYLWGAVHLRPNVVNPSGYSLFLWLLKPFHSLALVVGIQHAVGLGIAVAVYALARRYGLPAWAATLAAAPVLFDPAQILVEQFVMADLLAMALMVGAFTVMLWRSLPSVPRVAAAGLLMGTSVTIRPTTLPLLALAPLFLLLKKVGWRQACASLLAGALPVVGYMSWFAAAHGSFNLTNSNGLFLWSRTMSFANCAVIKPPAGLGALCPDAQPGDLGQPDPAKRPRPTNYLWSHRTWQWRDVPSRFVPDTAAFTPANNSRALRFAKDAIVAQPVAYVRVVADATLEPFIKTNSLRFPAVQPGSGRGQNKAVRRYAVAAVRAYTGSSYGVPRDLSQHYDTVLRPPFAYLMDVYQRAIFLPGPLLALIMLAGLAGIFLPRRRVAAAALLWASAVTIIVLPVAEHEYAYRYMVPAIPLACLAAAMAARKPGTGAYQAQPAHHAQASESDPGDTA